jgi:hypothetical protein
MDTHTHARARGGKQVYKIRKVDEVRGFIRIMSVCKRFNTLYWNKCFIIKIIDELLKADPCFTVLLVRQLTIDLKFNLGFLYFRSTRAL